MTDGICEQNRRENSKEDMGKLYVLFSSQVIKGHII